MKYRSSYVHSNSDFWWDSIRKAAFAACVANVMLNMYRKTNGTLVAISDATLKTMNREELVTTTPTIDKCPLLLDFCCFDVPKTGRNIGMWLDNTHERHGIKPDHLGSHIVDGAANAGKSVRCLELTTSNERSQKMTKGTCDSHSCNTSSGIASGTSDHKVSSNPELGSSLDLIHAWLTRIRNNGEQRKVLNNVRVENGREVFESVKNSQATRWNSRYYEARCANLNQTDLATVISRLTAKGGVDDKLKSKNDEDDNVPSKIPEEYDWLTWWQYEGAMMPMYRFSMHTQSSSVTFHCSLFEAKRQLEQLQAPWFEMYENVSALTGENRATNLKVRLPGYVPFYVNNYS